MDRQPPLEISRARAKMNPGSYAFSPRLSQTYLAPPRYARQLFDDDARRLQHLFRPARPQLLRQLQRGDQRCHGQVTRESLALPPSPHASGTLRDVREAESRVLLYQKRERADTRPGDLKLQTLTPIGVHEVAYEAVLREIGGIAPMASMS